MDMLSSPSREMSTKMESLCLDSSPDFGPLRCEMNKVRFENKQSGDIRDVSKLVLLRDTN